MAQEGQQFADSGKCNSTKMRQFKGFWKEHYTFLASFFDERESEYGQASYLRMENENGNIHCCLIFRTSRVAPVKYVLIPRLELTADAL